MPTEHRVWSCDICKDEYPSEREAIRCESTGYGVPPSWLHKGATVYGFGENGVIGPAKVNDTYISHDVRVILDCGYMSLSHNFNWTVYPAYAFNPMNGVDFMRYIRSDNVESHASLWIDACRHYGIEPDPNNANWSKYPNEQHTAIIDAIMRILNQ